VDRLYPVGIEKGGIWAFGNPQPSGDPLVEVIPQDLGDLKIEVIGVHRDVGEDLL